MSCNLRIKSRNVLEQIVSVAASNQNSLPIFWHFFFEARKQLAVVEVLFFPNLRDKMSECCSFHLRKLSTLQPLVKRYRHKIKHHLTYSLLK